MDYKTDFYLGKVVKSKHRTALEIQLAKELLVCRKALRKVQLEADVVPDYDWNGHMEVDYKAKRIKSIVIKALLNPVLKAQP